MKILSGSEAKLAWAKGAEIEFYSEDLDEWFLVDGETFTNVFDQRKCRIKFKLETVEIVPPKKVTLDPITGSVGLVYGDIGVATEQMEAIVKQLNLSMNGY